MENIIDVENCPICMDELTDGNIIILKCCKNKIHLKCIMKCIENSKYCPLCRDVENIQTNLVPLFDEIDDESETEETPILMNRQEYSVKHDVIKCITFSIGLFITTSIVTSILYGK